MQILSANIFVIIWKYYGKYFTLKHLVIFKIYVRGRYERFVYKHLERIEYVKN